MTNDIMHDGVVEFNYELIDDKFAEWNQASTEVYQKSKLSKRKRKKNSKATDALMLIDLEEQQQVVKEEVNKHLEQEHPLHVMVRFTLWRKVKTRNQSLNFIYNSTPTYLKG